MSEKPAASCFIAWSRLRTRLYSSAISSMFANFGQGSRVSPPFRFSNLHQISIGHDVTVHKDCWICVINQGGDDSNVKVDIGAHSAIGMGATISAAHSVILSDHVLLARNVYISDHGHAFEDVTRPIINQGITQPGPVYIGPGSWLGQNVVVLPGSNIGAHCVVGANSVVRGSIPDFTVAAGVPARVVKRYNQDTQLWHREAK